MGALRSSRPALLLPRDRPLRAHHRSAASARVDHQGRLHARQTAAGRGRLPLPPRSVVGAALERRPRGQAPEIIRISWRAQRRRERPLAPAQRCPPQTRWGRRGHGSPASSPRTAGRSPPGPLIPIWFRRHPCRRATPSRTQPRSRTSTHPPPAGGSPTRAELTFAHQPGCGWRGGPSLPGSRTQLRDLSREQHPPGVGSPRSTLDSGRATNTGLGVPSPRI